MGLAPGPLGRVGAEIVCDDTLVQYAAYLALFSLRRSGWYHSIPIILVGMALHSFFPGQFMLPPLRFLGGGVWKEFFWRPC
ncbi:hypothetical protein PDIG_51030 [Penicillium digitatum PHI26]|uniref:Uncharacterized protein n=2 Tax=Penicillium digitatum TaxID=36651 RepID=K9FS24_PEND2|nr:hypothetical protein PDIP_20250 [Penicillium digitatum Pd1]EKV11267.1 hypothetical protein PDIG_51030 [Penicillium digitatum PHI26]EKV20090.1 hypothetical protein PDIP_20250 [Penicillium digitatum Pd1]